MFRSRVLRATLLAAIFLGLPAAALVARSMSLARRSAGPASAGDDRLNQPASFIYIDRGDIITLDLNRMSWLQDIRVGENLFEGLYRLDPRTLACTPGVAERIESTPDKTHFTFHLRNTAHWSNGDPVTSADFVFAWRRMLEEPAEYTYLLHYIKGAEAYEDAFARDTRSANFSTVGVRVPDSATLDVTLAHPVTFFPDLCAFVPFFPLNERSMASFKRIDPATGRVSYDEKFTRPGKLVSNGAYQLTAWQLKVGLRLDANPHYWDAAHVRSHSVRVVVAEEPLIGLRKYDNGEVDWLAEPDADISAGLIALHRPDIHICPSNGTYFYSFNCHSTLPDGRPNPLADVRVRRALSMVVNKTPIVQKITRCGEPATNDYIPPGVFPGYRSPPGLPLDIEAARRLLTEAGYPGGRNFPPMTLLFNSEGGHQIIAEYVTKQWKDQLNIDIAMESVEVAEFRERLHDHRYAIARASWYGDYNDISTFTDKYRSDSDNNDSGWSNKQYDALCAQAAIESDDAKRRVLFEQAENILLNEAPIFPLYVYTNRYVFRDTVHGLSVNSRNRVSFAAISTGRP